MKNVYSSSSASSSGTARVCGALAAGSSSSFPKRRPASCTLMTMKRLKNNHPKMVAPMIMKADLYPNWQNPRPNATAPVFPPAPTIAAMDPVLGRPGYGNLLDETCEGEASQKEGQTGQDTKNKRIKNSTIRREVKSLMKTWTTIVGKTMFQPREKLLHRTKDKPGKIRQQQIFDWMLIVNQFCKKWCSFQEVVYL